MKVQSLKNLKHVINMKEGKKLNTKQLSHVCGGDDSAPRKKNAELDYSIPEC